MKLPLFIAFLLLSLFSFSQNPDSCGITKEVDEFDKQVTYDAGIFHIADYGVKPVYLSMIKLTGNIYIHISIESDRPLCFEKDSKVVFLYEDGSKDTCLNIKRLNCESSLSLVAPKKISYKVIHAIRAFSTNGFIDLKANKETRGLRDNEPYPIKLMNAAKCLKNYR